MNPLYGKHYNASLLADGTTATPTSPSIHSGQQSLNVILKNPMGQQHPLEQNTGSIESGPPPLYHSVYNNFNTWNMAPPSSQHCKPTSQSDDLLLMDVSFFGTGTNSHSSPSNDPMNGGWTTNTLPTSQTYRTVPYNHAQQQSPYNSDVLYSANPMLIPSSSHVSTTALFKHELLSSPNAPPPSYHLNENFSFIQQPTNTSVYFSQPNNDGQCNGDGTVGINSNTVCVHFTIHKLLICFL